MEEKHKQGFFPKKTYLMIVGSVLSSPYSKWNSLERTSQSMKIRIFVPLEIKIFCPFLLSLQIFVTQWKMKSKHDLKKKKKKWRRSHSQNIRKFWSILVDSINPKIHVQSSTLGKDPLSKVQHLLHLLVTLLQRDRHNLICVSGKFGIKF